MNHLIVDPCATGPELALTFGRTPAWISTIINSQAVQARLAEKQSRVFGDVVVPLRDKLEGVAHAAVEKLGTALQNTQDPKFVLDVADKALHRLGYAPSRQAPSQGTVVNQQVNVYGEVDAKTIASARAMIGKTPRDAAKQLNEIPSEETAPS